MSDHIATEDTVSQFAGPDTGDDLGDYSHQGTSDTADMPKQGDGHDKLGEQSFDNYTGTDHTGRIDRDAAADPNDDAALDGAEGYDDEGEGVEISDEMAGTAPDYTDLSFDNLPEGVAINEDFQAAAYEQFKAANLSTDQAQTMVDTYVDMLDRMQTDQLQAIADQRSQWVKEVKQDPDYGGGRLQETTAQVRGLIGRYADEEVRTLMNETGIGDHPALVRLFAKIAADMGEDTLTTGSATSPRPSQSITDRWYRSNNS